MGPSVLPPKVCRLTAAPLPRATTLLCPLTVTPSRPPPAMWRREVPLETGEQSCSKVGVQRDLSAVQNHSPLLAAPRRRRIALSLN